MKYRVAVKSDKDSYDLEQILQAQFPNVATHKWCVIYNELHPTLIRNLVDWIFLAQSLCRGIPASDEQVTNFDKVSVINHCVELVFRPLGTGGKKYTEFYLVTKSMKGLRTTTLLIHAMISADCSLIQSSIHRNIPRKQKPDRL